MLRRSTKIGVASISLTRARSRALNSSHSVMIDGRVGVVETGVGRSVVEADAARDVHHVGVETLAKIGDLVDERYLHRQEHVRGVFDHLRTSPRSVDHLAAGALDRLVNIRHDRAGALVVDSNDHTIGLLEVLDRRALAEKFRIGYDSEAVARQAFLRNALDFVPGADRNRRLDDDDSEFLDDIGDRPRGVIHEG